MARNKDIGHMVLISEDEGTPGVYACIEYKGAVYYIGEEVVLDANQCQIGWISSRGMTVLTALDPDTGAEVGRMDVRSKAPNGIFQTDGDIIEAINFLRRGTFES